MVILKHGLDALKSEYFQELDSDQIHIKKDLFNQFPDPAVCWRVLEDFGFSVEQAQDVFKNIDGQSGDQFFSKTHRLVIDRDSLIIQPLNTVAVDEVILITGEGKFKLSNCEIVCQVTNRSFNSNSNEAWLDYSKLKFPLTWRKWKEGDRFIPLGMKTFKKISDFLIDEKISIPGKEKVTVMESGGEIVWLVGLRIDDRVKLDEATSEGFQMKVLET